MVGLTRITKPIDWQLYSDIYPNRYIQNSNSDFIIQNELSKIKHGKALDVGGGVNGTSYLINWATDYLLLDTGVKSNLPFISWNDLNSNSFNVVLARNSINYLCQFNNHIQIAQIAKSVCNNGKLIFNTFVSPPRQMKRRYLSKSSSGIEIAKIIANTPVVIMEHTLIPDDTNYIIKHKFFYYPIIFLKTIIESEGLLCRVIVNKKTAVFICDKY